MGGFGVACLGDTLVDSGSNSLLFAAYIHMCVAISIRNSLLLGFGEEPE